MSPSLGLAGGRDARPPYGALNASLRSRRLLDSAASRRLLLTERARGSSDLRFAPEQPPQAAGAPTPPGTNPMDTAGTGGGTIGTGQVPTPGEQGFTGSQQGATPEAQATGQQQSPMATLQ